MKKSGLILTTLAAAGILSACGASGAATSDSEETIVLGYFPNLDHATAMVAKDQQFYESNLPEGTNVEYVTFAVRNIRPRYDHLTRFKFHFA